MMSVPWIVALSGLEKRVPNSSQRFCRTDKNEVRAPRQVPATRDRRAITQNFKRDQRRQPAVFPPYRGVGPDFTAPFEGGHFYHCGEDRACEREDDGEQKNSDRTESGFENAETVELIVDGE